MVARKSTKDTGASKLALAPDASHVLLLKNLSESVIVIKSAKPNAEDAVVQIQSEVVLGPEWIENRSVQALILNGTLAYEWVDRFYQPASLPDAGEAPAEIIPRDNYEREFARQIALGSKERALSSIAVTRTLDGTGETDVRYMKDRFIKVLRLALWYEEQLKQRLPILDALKERIESIRGM